MSAGINVHLDNTSTPYFTQFSTVEAKLQSLGIRHLRWGLSTNSTAITNQGTLASAGFDFILVVDPRQNSTTSVAVTKADAQIAGVAAWDGPNELDNDASPIYMGLSWAAGAVLWAQDWWTACKADVTCGAEPIMIGSMAQSSRFVTQFCPATTCPFADADIGNLHSYAGPSFAANGLDQNVTNAQVATGGKSIWASEGFGSWNTSGANTTVGIDEAAQGVYMSNAPFEYFNRNAFGHGYVYELLDICVDLTNLTCNWGILHNDLTPKAAYTALQNILGLLADAGHETGSKSVKLGFGGSIVCLTDCAGVHYCLLFNSSNHVFLALWQEALVYNKSSNLDIVVPPVGMNIALGDAWSSAKLYEPMISASPYATYAAPTSVPVKVPADVVIIELVP